MSSAWDFSERHVATWLLFFYLLCLRYFAESFVDIISPYPQNNSLVAVGGFPPPVKAIITRSLNGSTTCTWTWNGVHPFYASFYKKCYSRNTTQFSFTCFKFNETTLESVFNILSPLKSNVSLELGCAYDEPGIPYKPFLLRTSFVVKECPRKFLPQIEKPQIVSTNFTYGATGVYKCDRGKLYYNNGTKANETTTCLNDATWSGESSVECWNVLNTTLTGEYYGAASSNVTVECNVVEPVFPPVVHYTLFIGDNLILHQNKQQTVTFTLQPDMNNQLISCRAHSKYTQVDTSLGWSQNYTLIVTYAPYLSNNLKCYMNQPCTILISANPLPLFVKLILPDKEKKLTWTKQNNETLSIQLNEPTGVYDLEVSNLVGINVFQLTVNKTVNLPLIVGISAAGMFLIALLVVVILVFTRKTNKTKGKQAIKISDLQRDKVEYEDTGTNFMKNQPCNTSEYMNINADTTKPDSAPMYMNTHAKTDETFYEIPISVTH